MELFLLLLFIFTFIVYEVHIWVEAEHVLLIVGSVPALFWLWLWLVSEYQTSFFLLKKQYLHRFKMLLLWLNVDHSEINIQERLWDKKCWMEFGFVVTFSGFGKKLIKSSGLLQSE